jgi:hypothetical protein
MHSTKQVLFRKRRFPAVRGFAVLGLAAVTGCSQLTWWEEIPDPGLQPYETDITITNIDTDTHIETASKMEFPDFEVWNRSDFPRTEWVAASIPFPRGMITELEQLDDLLADGEPTESLALKWHYDPNTGDRESLAIAQVRTNLTLNAGERRTVSLEPGDNTLPPFEFGEGFNNFLADYDAVEAFLVMYLEGDSTPHFAFMMGDQLLITDQSESLTDLRGRGHFYRNGVEQPLSVTTYMRMNSGQDHGELVMTIGNNTLRHAAGEIQIESLQLHTLLPLRVGIRDKEAYGFHPPVMNEANYEVTTLLQNVSLSDGQSWPVRGAFGFVSNLDTPAGDNFQALVDSPLLPVADFEHWQASQAAGAVGFILEPRFSSVEEGQAAVDWECNETIVAGPFDDLGYINKRPGNTGDQPDFTSNLPLFAIQVLQTGSPCPARKAALAVDRESLRPSFFWWRDPDGVERPIHQPDFPEMFYWSGRPHYDYSWNKEYPEWASRCQAGCPSGTPSFARGGTFGWGAMDDQHYGNNALRSMYELTGDPYLRDLLEQHQSLLTWNLLTKYMHEIPAERSARLLKEAVALYQLIDDGPASAEMRSRVEEKNRDVLRDLVNEYRSIYDVAAIDDVRNDGRVPLTIEYPDEPVAVGWQTGFHMEFQALAYENGWDPSTAAGIMDDYLKDSDKYFDATGQPVTYFLMADPSAREFGGIGEGWWAGWVRAAQTRPSSDGADRILNSFTPRLRSALTPGSNYWGNGDRWRCFE